MQTQVNDYSERVARNAHNEKPSIRERFDAHHEKNPHIWKAFENVAYNYIESGNTKLFHRKIGWDLRDMLPSSKGETYKVNNTYLKGYAMKFMKTHPQFEGWFKTRGEW
jgi:hypothetical protein